MLEAILLVIAPLAVTFLTQVLKQAQSIQQLYSPQKKAVVRFIAVVISFTAVLVGGIASGEMIDESVITTFVEVVAVFIASQVTYAIAKKQKSDTI